MDITLESVGTVVGVLLGIGTIGAVVYKYWGLPDRMQRLEEQVAAGLEDIEKQVQAEKTSVLTSLTNTITVLKDDLTRQIKVLDADATGIDALLHSSRAEIFAKIHELRNQITENKLEATTAMTAIREIQNGIREKFVALERVEGSVGLALQANAEKRALLDRLRDDYQQLQSTVQQLNREIGELRGATTGAYEPKKR